MPEKLKASAWTDLVKKLKIDVKTVDLKDKDFAKALTACEKSDEGKGEVHAKVLDELVEQSNKLVVALARIKKDLGGDKPFKELKDKLHELGEEAERQAKATRERVLEDQSKAAKDGKGGKSGEGDDEEPDTPVLLTSKLIPLIRELKKGEVRMPALVCTAGKNTAVLFMRRPIAVSRRKLLMEAVDAKGGAKFLPGEVLYEKGAMTFVLQASAGGLAKRIRAALLNQTELRLKVKVRGNDGEDVDGEEEPDPGEAPGAQAQAQGVRKAPPGGPASAEQLSYTQRLRKVRDRYDEALRAQHPESTKLRAVMGFASEKAGAEPPDWVGASKALDMLDKLLGAGTGTAESATATVAPQGVRSAPTGQPASAEQLAYTQRLLKVRDRYEQALRERHPNTERLTALLELAREKAKLENDYAGAIEALKALEQALGPATGRPSSSANPEGNQQGAASLASFNARFSALGPKIKAATAKGGPAGKAIRQKAGEASVLATASKVSEAMACLDELVGLLDGASGASSQGDDAIDRAAAAQWPSRLAGAEKLLDEAQKKNPGGAAKLQALMDYALGKATSGEHAKAIAGLEQLAGRLAALPAQPGRKVSPAVAFTQARLAWDQTRKAVHTDLLKLEAAIVEACKDEANLEDIVAGAKGMFGLLEHLDERLMDKLDEALNAADAAQRQRLNGEARSIVSEYIDFVRTEDFMQAVDDNGFVDVAIFSKLTRQLAAIDQQLEALAA